VTDQKKQKHKKVMLPTSHGLNVNVILSNIPTFYDFSLLFDPSPLILWLIL